MRGAILFLCMIGASAFVLLTSMPGRDCDREVLSNDKTTSLQVVTFQTNCGKNNMATEVALAPLAQADVTDAEPILILPGRDHPHVKVQELGEQIAVTYPRGSKMIALEQQYAGRPIRFIAKEPKKTAAKP